MHVFSRTNLKNQNKISKASLRLVKNYFISTWTPKGESGKLPLKPSIIFIVSGQIDTETRNACLRSSQHENESIKMRGVKIYILRSSKRENIKNYCNELTNFESKYSKKMQHYQ